MTMLSTRPETAQDDDPQEAPEVRSLVAAWYAGTLGRREFIARATVALGSLAAATTLLAACSAGPSVVSPAGATNLQQAPGTAVVIPSPPPPPTPTFPPSQIGTRVPPVQRMVTFKSGDANIMAYEARPQGMGNGPFPAIIVIHENMGLTEHIQDVTRRAAKEGFIGFGMDYLSRDGGTMSLSTPQDVTAAINRLSDDQIIADTTAAVQYLTANGATKVGVVGFCWGGRRSLLVAERSDGIAAAVSYYGGGLPQTNAQMTINVLDETKNIRVPVLGNYGGQDPVISQDIVNTLRNNLMASGQPMDIKVFDGAGHAFNNDTRPAMGAIGYNPPVATEAWGRTIAWFRQYLA